MVSMFQTPHIMQLLVTFQTVHKSMAKFQKSPIYR